MNAEKLTRIIERHQHYLAQDCEGWEKMKADLVGADLSCANLGGANLRRADLFGADLSFANLSAADLSGAELRFADISEANLSGADLSSANLSEANLSAADLSGANLSGAELISAYLGGAILSGANLSGGIYNCYTAFLALACPEEGDFIGWKKVRDSKCRYVIKLHIPADAKRSSATSRKCRCSHAEVLEIQNLDGSKADTDSVTNDTYDKITYTVGETVHADKWDEDRWNECSHGIHFFITRDEAVSY